MAGEFAVVFEVLLDDIYAFHFIEEEDDLRMHVFYGNKARRGPTLVDNINAIVRSHCFSLQKSEIAR